MTETLLPESEPKYSKNRQIKESGRWRWTCTASAALGAIGGSQANGETVEINLQNQIYSVQNGVESTAPLNLDITGDTIPDFSTLEGVPLTQTRVVSSQNPNMFYNKFGAALQMDTRPLSVSAYARADFTTVKTFPAQNETNTVTNQTAVLLFKRVGSMAEGAALPGELTGFLPIVFSDAGINSNQDTFGYLQIRVLSTSSRDHFIELQKVIFDNANTEYPVVENKDYPDFVRGTTPSTGPNPPATSDPNSTSPTPPATSDPTIEATRACT